MKITKTLTYRFLASLTCILLLSSCVKNEFKVDFEFPKDHIGNYLMKYYAWDKRGGRWIEHTASIQEGMATADGITRLPTLVYVTDASNKSNSMILYVERGDRIKISGDGRDMASWSVKGNKLSERWSEWRKTAYPKKNDSKAFKKSIEEYVTKNPKDELSTLLLLMEWNRRDDPDGFVKLWNSIDKGARGSQLIEMCGVSDMLGVEFTTMADGSLKYSKDAKVKNLVVRSRDNGTDTLRFNKPAFLYFFSENNNARRETRDSLKHLSTAYPDSSKRVMADIYLDSDSITWVNSIRRDSLGGVVRAWLPCGVAEDDMIRMGVVRLPWFIVKDKSAKEVYAGPDLKDATVAFRKIAGKPDPKANAKAKEESKKEEKPKTVEKPVQKPKPGENSTSRPKPRLKPEKPSKINKQSDR